MSFRSQFIRGRNKGFSLIEIIFVIALLGTLMTIVFRSLSGPTTQARIDEAKLAMGGTIAQALQLYQIHNGKFPSTADGLNALITAPADAKAWAGPYLSDNQLKDPWQNEFKYESDGRNYKITSAGPDGQMGNEDDVTYPETTQK